MPKLSIVTPCYNERGNVRPLRERTLKVLEGLAGFDHEHIFIDNASTDGTAQELRSLAREDKRVKVIVNARNFGHIRSPHHAMLQARGDAVVLMASDLQDPPELIAEFVKKWQEGFKIVLAVKTESEESPVMFLLRKAYYDLVGRLAEVRLVKNATGFGLYDRAVMDAVAKLDDPYPYFRGIVCDIGFEQAHVPFTQPLRRRGVTKNNFYTLYDIAMLGITSHSKVPLRLAAMLGFAMSAFGFLLAMGYLVAKLVFWNQFKLGTAPTLIGFFLFSSVQLFFIGIVGEYIGAIHTQVLKRPLVVEKERINF
ncbi:MAG: glycosyltransferase family 2 protein [Elusimicrobia bacterium]|nr:glycosyltransferase family 2 protein [Elusimicrobiota bacterium]